MYLTMLWTWERWFLVRNYKVQIKFLSTYNKGSHNIIELNKEMFTIQAEFSENISILGLAQLENKIFIPSFICHLKP